MPVTLNPVKLPLTGPPKVGKRTVVARLVRSLRQQGVSVGGFITREIKIRDRRTGFVVQDLAGPEAVLASEEYQTSTRVGRFGVDVVAFERISLPALRHALTTNGVVVIDEIARMELASEAFIQLVSSVMDLPLPLVATVHVHVHPFTDALKQRPDVTLLTLTEDNRDGMERLLLARLTVPELLQT